MTKCESNWSSLHDAVIAQNCEKVAFALSRGESPDTKDKYGSTPLIDSVKFSNSEIVRLLIMAGADIFLKDDIGDSAGLHACLGGNEKALAMLLVAAGPRANDLFDAESLSTLAMEPLSKNCICLLNSAGITMPNDDID